MKSPHDAAKRGVPVEVPQRVSRPTATATIEPMGQRADAPREHLIKVTIELNASDARYADKAHVAGTARQSLGAYSPASGEADGRTIRELSVSRKGKAGTVTSVVVAVEGSVVWPRRPPEDSVEVLRAALVGEGYSVQVRERRECTQSPCATDAMVDWQRPEDVPTRWFSNRICGKHDYRSCAKCKSIYLLTSTNAAGQAPAVHCEVCGLVMVEWGSSKVWTADLVTRGPAAG